MELAHWVSELKRRRVIRALLGWGLLAFAILQVYEPVMHGLRLPEWTLTLVVLLLAAGFPMVTVLAWIFDVRPGGIARTAPAAPPDDASPRAAHRARLALLLVGLGILAAAPGLGWYFLGRTRARAPGSSPPPSIAVLPFSDLSPQKDQEYFSDGLAEEILNALAQLDGLHVAGRTSSFSFKGKAEDIATIGSKLHVSSVLEGSVRKAGQRVRITAQLVNAADGYHLWSQTYDRELTDVFAVQDDIARSVVESLRVKLLAAEHPSTRAYRTANPQVYDQYLLGRELMRRGNRGGFHLAIAAFERAIALEPGYAPAWAALSSAWYWYGNSLERVAEMRDYKRRSIDAAQRAVALDPGLADAYAARGFVRASAKQWSDARADLERALALNPGSADAHWAYGRWVLTPLGRQEDAIAELKRATQIDPLEAKNWSALAGAHLRRDDLAEAHAALARALELAPDAEIPPHFIVVTLLLEGRAQDALRQLAPRPPTMWRVLDEALVQHALGHTQEAQRALDALIAGFAETAAYQIAEVYAWRGDRERAFEWLERAYVLEDDGLLALRDDVLLRSLRGDPRRAALLRRLNLPDGS